jgi:hypothetical protein
MRHVQLPIRQNMLPQSYFSGYDSLQFIDKHGLIKVFTDLLQQE